MEIIYNFYKKYFSVKSQIKVIAYFLDYFCPDNKLLYVYPLFESFANNCKSQ